MNKFIEMCHELGICYEFTNGDNAITINADDFETQVTFTFDCVSNRLVDVSTVMEEDDFDEDDVDEAMYIQDVEITRPMPMPTSTWTTTENTTPTPKGFVVRIKLEGNTDLKDLVPSDAMNKEYTCLDVHSKTYEECYRQHAKEAETMRVKLNKALCTLEVYTPEEWMWMRDSFI